MGGDHWDEWKFWGQNGDAVGRLQDFRVWLRFWGRVEVLVLEGQIDIRKHSSGVWVDRRANRWEDRETDRQKVA